jgi:hypothetical protein
MAMTAKKFFAISLSLSIALSRRKSALTRPGYGPETL